MSAMRQQRAKLFESILRFLECCLVLSLVSDSIGGCAGIAIPVNRVKKATPKVQCPHYRSKLACGCSGFSRPNNDDTFSNGVIQSDMPGHIETDDDGTEYLVIDDMMFPRSPISKSSSQADQVIADPNNPNYKLDLKFWPGGIIFYNIDPAFSLDYSNEILNAMQKIEENVGKNHLEFKKAKTSSGAICRKGYLFVKRASKRQCRAQVGMSVKHTYVWLHPDACPFGTIQHEILHALGRYHEQCRPDRDKYVTLLPQNMAAYECANYYITMDGPDPSLKLTYDSASIMHYGSCHFSCNGAYTMIKKSDGSKIEPNRQSMTKLDVDKMRALYPKEFKVPYSESMCAEDGVVEKRGKKTFGQSCRILIIISICLTWMWSSAFV
ncbi:hypothetical protein BOX15_Mlig026304g1 [Macrostomum lignano]|uniref:Metalloendopeptidase n=1 Tax=Macrostomum lignano TaxID=282301 RepID=A0A267EML0_9PLAT|nr:hypothetical protein BOX15_Mlig026304g1 [Macrostomum lignano]